MSLEIKPSLVGPAQGGRQVLGEICLQKGPPSYLNEMET